MQNIIHLDFEIFSNQDLKKVGAYRYAHCDSTEILMAALQLNDEEPVLWLPEKYESLLVAKNPRADELLAMLSDPKVLVYAHNAKFEHAICQAQLFKQTGFAPPKREQWRCTMAMALRACLPAGLDKLGEFLQIENQKDKKGSSLIQKFCKPKTKKVKGEPIEFRNFPEDHEEDWEDFCNYCLQDVRAEVEISKRLSHFELKGEVLATFLYDLKLNDEGIPVDVPSLQKAQVLIEEIEKTSFKEFAELTDGLRPTQRAKVLEILNPAGFPFDGLRAAEMEQYINSGQADKDLKGDARRILQLRFESGSAAVKKVKTMLDCEIDGKVQGTLQYHGANTGRWAGRLIQPHNFKRPTIKGTGEAYDLIGHGCEPDDLRMIWGNPLEVIGSCVRHFIKPKTGKVYDADFASIEARGVSWIAEDEEGVADFMAKKPMYEAMGSAIFGCSIADISKREKSGPTLERFVGKQAVLGCGYGMGVDKFMGTCEGYGTPIPRELADKAVKTYREKRNKVVQFWYALDRGCKNAVKYPGRAFDVNKHIKTFRVTVSEIDFLFIKLPSGRCLSYPLPECKKTSNVWKGKVMKGEEITFYGQSDKGHWGRNSTYGGKLTENVVQALSADLMAHGMKEADKKGFTVFTTIHDQALAYEHPELSIQDFEAALSSVPHWAKGLPLVAEGKVERYYSK